MGEIWYTYKDIELIVAVVFGKRGKGWIKAIIAEFLESERMRLYSR